MNNPNTHVPQNGSSTKVKISQQTVVSVTEISAMTLPVSAPFQLYWAAAPLKSQTVDDLRQQAATVLNELKIKLWEISFEGLKTILAFKGDSPTSPQDMYEARQLCGKYLALLERIEILTGDKAKAEYNYQQRLKNLDVFPSGKYSVQVSDATIHVNTLQDPSPQEESKSKDTGTHEEYIYKIEKILKQVGFDNEGKPIREWQDDVTKKTIIVPNEK